MVDINFETLLRAETLVENIGSKSTELHAILDRFRDPVHSR